ncbi:MAG: hypothetical protein FWF08_07325 [Oscillospiraceae bacterium]|nr:hypothetical protein [Oscillospiraceae bacterium]
MKTGVKKLISTALALIMLFGLFAIIPFTANAAGPVCKIGNVNYDTLEEAVAAVPENSDVTTITFLSSIVCPDGLVVDNKNITFDFGLFNTLTLEGDLIIRGEPKRPILDLWGATYNVTFNGNIILLNNAKIENGKCFTLIKGNITANSHDIDAPAVCGVGTNNQIEQPLTIDGNITTSGIGVFASSGFIDYITGTVYAECSMLVKGNIKSTGIGVKATGGAVIQGNITSLSTGIYIYNNGYVRVKGTGNVKASDIGVEIENTGRADIKGNISAPTYIKIQGDIYTAKDYISTSKYLSGDGRYTYANSFENPEAAVHVGIYYPPNNIFGLILLMWVWFLSRFGIVW